MKLLLTNIQENKNISLKNKIWNCYSTNIQEIKN